MKSINTSKTKHELLYMIPGIQVLDCKKMELTPYMLKCWLKLSREAANKIWNALIQVKAQHNLTCFGFDRIPHDIRVVKYWNPTYRNKRCIIGAKSCFCVALAAQLGFGDVLFIMFISTKKLILEMMLILSTGDHIRWW